MSRYECPECGTDDITTIHDDLHACNADGCEAIYNPRADDPDPTFPRRGAIGFCPRCDANARDGQSDVVKELFECPECGHEWCEMYLDGVALANHFDLHGWPRI